jgi:hypothetical protein
VAYFKVPVLTKQFREKIRKTSKMSVGRGLYNRKKGLWNAKQNYAIHIGLHNCLLFTLSCILTLHVSIFHRLSSDVNIYYYNHYL